LVALIGLAALHTHTMKLTLALYQLEQIK
jgi:hypothetical protein